MMASMRERKAFQVRVHAAAFVVICCGIGCEALAQGASVARREDPAAMEQRAKAVEGRVVDDYGTPAQIYAFKNPIVFRRV